MASGGERQFSLQRAGERDTTPNGGQENGRIESRSGDERSTGRRKRGYVPQHRVRERHDPPLERTPRGRGREAERIKPSGVNALQLEPTTGGGRGRVAGRRAGGPLQPYRAFEEDGVINTERASSARRKREVHSVSRGREQRRDQRRDDETHWGRGVRGKDKKAGEEASMNLLRRSEEKATEAVRLWREGCTGYHDVEPHVSSVWFRYQGVLECGMERAVRENLGQRVWRCIHYPIIELLRKPDAKGGMEGQEMLDKVLEIFSDQYLSLLGSLQQKHSFKLDHILSSGLSGCSSKRHKREVMLALIPCHWCYVCLGDLSRYRQQLATPPNWAKPRSYYLKAIQLVPKSGRPYNQLAVIAINAHRRLDAVYYYMRSLFAKTPVQSAHDSLVCLFEESSRKEMKVQEDRERERGKLEREALRRMKREEKKQMTRKRRGEGGRGDRHEIVFESGHREVWVVPGSEEWHTMRRGGGGEKERDVGDDGEKKSEAVSEDSYCEPEGELVKHLTAAFLIVHGKLYTKIGIDEMEGAMLKLLKLWRRMLTGQLDMESARRMVKMAIINICSIHHGLKSSDTESGQKYYCNLAFHIATQLTVELVERCRGVLETLHTRSEAGDTGEGEGGGGGEEGGGERGDSGLGVSGSGLSVSVTNEDTVFSPTSDRGEEVTTDVKTITFDLSSLSADQLVALEEVSVLLPAVRVWVEWVARQEDFWLPFLSPQNKSDLGAVLVKLSVVEHNLSTFSVPHSHVLAETAAGSEWAGLWEDKMLMGFMPLKDAVSTEMSLATPSLYRITSEQKRQQDLLRLVLLSRTCRSLSGHTHYNEGGALASVCVTNGQESDDSGEDVLVEGYSEEEGDEEGEEEGEEREERDEEGEKVDEEGGEEGEDVEGGVVSGEEGESVTAKDENIERLKAQKEKLSLEIREKRQAFTTTQTVLQEAATASEREVVVCARYLVPDTNGFVDHMSSIQAILECGHFIVAVPLVVVSELEGLSKGEVVKEAKNSGERGKKVMDGARQAVEFIKGSMRSGLVGITTRGNFLQRLTFSTEVTHKASNDDLILQSALSLHHKLSTSSSSPSTSLHTVVLLTDDRNLRVKAYAARMPVKDIPQFMDISRLIS